MGSLNFVFLLDAIQHEGMAISTSFDYYNTFEYDF